MKSNNKKMGLAGAFALSSFLVGLTVSGAVYAEGEQISSVAPSSAKPIPGTSTDGDHHQLVGKQNQQGAQKAQETGKSFTPVIVDKTSEGSNKAFEGIEQRRPPEKKEPAKKPEAAKEEPKKAEEQPQQAAPVAAPPAPVQKQIIHQPARKTKETEDRENNMAKAINGLLSGWNPVGQRVEIEYKGVAQDQAAPGSAVGKAAFAASAAPAQAGQAAGPDQNRAADLKAGSILHAVVLTSVNSDEPGPVLAQIVSGPYTGSKLMGSFKATNTKEKLILTFNVMTMPQAAHSYSINGFAIDPDTGRTALQSDVDHHYLERYGTLLGASFLKGYASALKQSNTTTQVSTGAAGSISTSTTPPLNAKDKAVIALGEVGTQLAAAMQDNVKRPITVTLDAGTPIGVLMMQDISFK